MPARVRQALDVEGGLNDGLAVPFFLVALDLANAELTTGVTWAVVSNAAEQIGWGLAAGVTAGLLGALAFRFADRRGWIGSEWRQIVPLAIALLAYALAVTLGGSGFIAAFVGGVAFGALAGAAAAPPITVFTEETGGLLAGRHLDRLRRARARLGHPAHHLARRPLRAAQPDPRPHAPRRGRDDPPGPPPPTWPSSAGSDRADSPTVVFALLVLERGVPEEQTLLTTVIVTVALSVILHGLTSVPLVRAYRRWYDGHAEAHPAAAEAVSATMPRQRRQLTAADSSGCARRIADRPPGHGPD